jgi:hypothetical protein
MSSGMLQGGGESRDPFLFVCRQSRRLKRVSESYTVARFVEFPRGFK